MPNKEVDFTVRFIDSETGIQIQENELQNKVISNQAIDEIYYAILARLRQSAS